MNWVFLLPGELPVTGRCPYDGAQGTEEQSSSRTFSFPCERQPTQFAANLRYSRYLYFYRRSNYCGLLGSLRSTYTK